MGDVLTTIGDARGGIEAFDGSLRIDPSYEDAYRGRADARLAVGQTALAIRDLDAALSISPDDADLIVLRADWLVSIDEYERALWDYDRASELEPESPLAPRGRAYARLMIGDNARSRHCQTSPRRRTRPRSPTRIW